MNRTLVTALLLLALVPASPAAKRKGDAGASGDLLRIADFESREERNDFDGGYFGIWNKDPDDRTQGCRMSFVEEGQGQGYYCLKLNYDVESPGPAYNGFWLLFIDLDLSTYDRIGFWLKGDKQAGFTKRFVVELKNEEEAGRYELDGVDDEWKRVEIPLSEFQGVRSWSAMTEFVIVFEDNYVTKNEGTIYLDNLYFARGRPTGTLDMADPRMTREELQHAITSGQETKPGQPVAGH